MICCAIEASWWLNQVSVESIFICLYQLSPLLRDPVVYLSRCGPDVPGRSEAAQMDLLGLGFGTAFGLNLELRENVKPRGDRSRRV